MKAKGSGQLVHRKKIYVFLGLTGIFSLIFYYLILGLGADGPASQFYLLGLMWSPGVAAIITSLIYDRNINGLGWNFSFPQFLPMAYVLPLIYAGPIYGIVWATRIAPFTMANLPEGMQIPQFILTNASIIFGLSIFSALGEEIGWRGLLVPQLAKEYNFSNTAVISGIIWAVWHFPLIVFGVYTSGAEISYSLATFFLLVLGVSLIMAWLTLRTGSLWPAVILHASHNVFIQKVFDPLTTPTYWGVRLTTEFGVGLAISALIVGYIFWRLRSRLPMSFHWSEDELSGRLGGG